MSDFDSIKVGVCDAYFTPVGSTTEIFLGLTKGGVVVTYTPEFHDIQVDQYGKTTVDSVLIGEAVIAKVPLVESDLKTLSLFAPTARKVGSGSNPKKITFGSRPGLRLSKTAGILRLHPVALGDSMDEDITIYRAANKGAMELNYKMDDEQVFNAEFTGMIVRDHPNGAMLWEMGNPLTDVIEPLKADLSNLSINYSIGASINPLITSLPTDNKLTAGGDITPTVSVVFEGQTYQVNSKISGKANDVCTATIQSTKVLNENLSDSIITVTATDPLKLSVKASATISALTKGASNTALQAGDVITTIVRFEFGSKYTDISFTYTV